MKKKKLVAPVIITVILILIYIVYFLVALICKVPIGVLITVGVAVAAITGVAIFVLIERIKEVRSGEEDDLSKY